MELPREETTVALQSSRGCKPRVAVQKAIERCVERCVPYYGASNFQLGDPKFNETAERHVGVSRLGLWLIYYKKTPDHDSICHNIPPTLGPGTALGPVFKICLYSCVQRLWPSPGPHHQTSRLANFEFAVG